MKKRKQMLGMFFVIFALAIIGIWGGKQLYFLFQEKESVGTGSSGKPSMFKFLAVTSCPAREGYEKCSENRYCYGEACAHPKLHTTFYNINKIHGSYVVKELKYKAYCEGDKLYLYKNLESWDDVHCDTEGCDGIAVPKEYTYSIAVVGEENPVMPVFVCWDYDIKRYRDGSYEWAWAWVGRGWVGKNRFSSYKVVKCYGNEDCKEDYICDKRGSWREWKCVKNPCLYFECPNKCVDNIRYYDGKCVLKNYMPYCEYRKENCYTEVAREFFCKGNDVYQVILKGVCTPEGCKTEKTSKYVKTCDYACKEGVCIVKEGFIGEAYCDDNKVVQNYQYEDGTVVVKLLEDCSSKGMVCKEGKCVKESYGFDYKTIIFLIALFIVILALMFALKRKWKS